MNQQLQLGGIAAGQVPNAPGAAAAAFNNAFDPAAQANAEKSALGLVYHDESTSMVCYAICSLLLGLVYKSDA